MRLLLRRGASPTRPNKDGVSPVDLAQEKVLPEVYSLLMQVRARWAPWCVVWSTGQLIRVTCDQLGAA